MNATATMHEWSRFLTFFNEQNTGRPTRLGIFSSQDGVVNDYWIEDGLPLGGVDLDSNNDVRTLQIKVGSLIHEVAMPLKLQFYMSFSGEEDGIDVLGGDGRTTILRFETDSH